MWELANGLRKENVCQGGVCEEHLPGILPRVGAEPVWLPAVTAWTCCCLFIVPSDFCVSLHPWSSEIPLRAELMAWTANHADGETQWHWPCWHCRSCLCHRVSGGQKCHRKCPNNFLWKDVFWNTLGSVLWSTSCIGWKVFPLRKARLSSDFVLISHKQWKNINSSCCVCKKARKVSGEKEEIYDFSKNPINPRIIWVGKHLKPHLVAVPARCVDVQMCESAEEKSTLFITTPQ